MKRKCKNIDITNIGLIRKAVYDCFKPAKKRRRRDTIALFKKYLPDEQKDDVYAILQLCTDEYYKICKQIAEDIKCRIVNEKLNLKPVTIKERKDPGTQKVRKIAVLSIEQLIMDHVAVLGMQEALKRVGVTQVSSIKGRGAHYGKKYIEKWLRTKYKGKKLYSAKLDIKDFYGSTQRAILVQWLEKHIKNTKLIWLITSLLNTTDKGLQIGSYLSQALANLYLSDIYHFAKEHCVSKRRNKIIHKVSECLFYMDDMVYIGTNKKLLQQACKEITDFAKNYLGLTIKPGWQVHLISTNNPIDIMGFRFTRAATTLRKRIARFAIRTLNRIQNNFRSIKFCRRLMSYKGYLIYTSTKKLLRKHDALNFFEKSAHTISIVDLHQNQI